MDWVIVLIHGYRYRITEMRPSCTDPIDMSVPRFRVEALDSHCPAPYLKSVVLVANSDHHLEREYIPHYPNAVARALEKKLNARIIATSRDFDPLREHGPDEAQIVY